MPHIVNPYGRIIAIDNDDQYQSLLNQAGFRAATDQEIEGFVAERTALAKELNTPDEEKQDITKSIYMATVSVGGRDGYGIASKHILKELKKLGQNVSLYQKGQKIGFLFHSPQALIKLDNPFKIIYTMFESTKIPDEWKEYLELADRVIVPSAWCAEVFAKAGVNAEVVPLGYDPSIYHYKERIIKRDHDKDFVFLHYNAFNLRKGFLEVLNAFTKAFQPDEPVKMVFKTNAPQIATGFNFVPSQYPNIKVINQGMTDSEMNDLCHEADAFVFPSRGEGFGMTPLEAMATGLPVIVPNAHGISEYFNPDCMYEVRVKEECPAVYARYKNQDVGHMYLSDVDHLAQQMRYIYEHQEEAQEKGKKAAEYAKNFTFEKTARRLNDIFSEYLDKEVVEKPLNNILQLEEVS